MRIVHIVENLQYAEGGIATVVTQLADSLADLNIDCQLLAFEGDESTTFTRVRQSVLPWLLKGELVKQINRQAGSNEKVIIHSHGLWAPLNIAAAACANTLGLPLVVSTHGMLLPWARSHKKLRKYFAWQLYQKSILEAAACIHTSSEAEVDQLAEEGLDSNIAMVPFGVPAPPVTPEQRPSDRRRLLFLGRLHPIKNLENLILAWGKTKPGDWELVIAGPGDPAYLARLNELVVGESLEGSVSFPGPVFGDDKWGLFHSADVVVLPSFSENFGAVVVEALLCGKPVIVSEGVPWRHLESLGCGWSVPGSVAGLSDAIRRSTALTEEERLVMGSAAMDYANREYSTEVCGGRFKKMYEDIV